MLKQRFAGNLKRLRAKHKVSQAETAHAAGLCVSMISMLEREERSPSLETVEVLAKVLGVDPMAMLKG